MRPERDAAFAVAAAAVLALLAAPLANVWLSDHPLPAALHGTGASLSLVAAAVVFHRDIVFARGGDRKARKRLARAIWCANAVVAATVATGNWLYGEYRSPNGAMEWFLLHAPAAHFVGMEFKEIVSLFSLPLGVAAGFVVSRASAKPGSELSRAAAHLALTLIALQFVALAASSAAGIVLAKWQMV